MTRVRYRKLLVIYFLMLLNITPQSGTIAIHVYRNVDEAVVEVRNSGKGIEPEELEKIFTRFYQVEKSSTVSEVLASVLL